MTTELSSLIIITGHYGSGKTNLAINLAMDLKRQGREVTLADLDVVNPYFRAADFVDLARENGIELIMSPYANSNLDIPSLTMSLDSHIGQEGTLIVDVGGDDAGAMALGRYAQKISQRRYDMLYVVNQYRMMIENPADAAVLLREIEGAARLRATAVINNSHLGHESTADIVKNSVNYAQQAAAACGLPLVASTIRRDLYAALPEPAGFYPVDLYVDLPWYGS